MSENATEFWSPNEKDKEIVMNLWRTYVDGFMEVMQENWNDEHFDAENENFVSLHTMSSMLAISTLMVAIVERVAADGVSKKELFDEYLEKVVCSSAYASLSCNAGNVITGIQSDAIN